MTGFFKKLSKKQILLIALTFLVIFSAVGGVWAYLASTTPTVTNTFQPAHVSCAVEEVFEDGIKSNVKVRNTGDITAWIRAAVVVNFINQEGKIASTTPQEGTDYSVTWAQSGWEKGSDGFWYHTLPVAPDALTSNLIESAQVTAAPAGCNLNIRIVATAIQSVPDTAVQEAWGVVITDGHIHPPAQ